MINRVCTTPTIIEDDTPNVLELDFVKNSLFFYELWNLKNTLGSGATTNVKVKSGVINSNSFSGNPKTYDVIFTSSFSGDYSISVIGEDVRVWSYENKTLSGFRINSNADQPLSGDIYWQAILNGEF
jgi:hypothetical protein